LKPHKTLLKLPTLPTFSMFTYPVPQKKPAQFIPSTLTPNINQCINQQLAYFSESMPDSLGHKWLTELMP
jgi:hypothetical protein